MRKLAASLLLLCGCTRPAVDSLAEPASSQAAQAEPNETLPWSRRVLATGLANPRGLLRLDERTVLVAEAGNGDPADRNSGRLLRLSDRDGDGTLETRETVIDQQPSVNIVERLEVHRDEVFGFADIERGNDMILATVADPTEGSVVWRVDQEPRPLSRTAGNANSVAWHPKLERWFAVQSFANTAIDLESGEVLVTFAPLAQAQDAVPAAIIYEPDHDALLVALFSGQLGGDTAGSGVDFVEGSGKVVRVDPRDGSVTDAALDLNAPTDLALAPDGRLLVLEFCDGFVDPVADLEDARKGKTAGGFSRFSGRLLAIGPDAERTVLAERLDLPTHLLVDGERILVTEGQGTPGRTIPGPDGPQTIDGRIVELTPR